MAMNQFNAKRYVILRVMLTIDYTGCRFLPTSSVLRAGAVTISRFLHLLYTAVNAACTIQSGVQGKIDTEKRESRVI